MSADQVTLPDTSVPTVRYIKPEPPLVHRFLRWHSIVQEETVEQVMERLDVLLRNVTGIRYKKTFGFKFEVGVTNYRGKQYCEILIFRNEGEHKKPMITSEVEGKPQFVIEYYDTSRYFTELFRYIIDNYSADTIRPFSSEDLNYGLYSFYSWEDDEFAEGTCEQVDDDTLEKDEEMYEAVMSMNMGKW